LFAVISNYPSLQSTITAIIPAKIPAAIPSARIAGTAAAELAAANVADAEVDVEFTLEVELVTTLVALGVVYRIDGIDEDVDMTVEVVNETVVIETAGIVVLVVDETGIKLEVDMETVEVLSVTVPVSDGSVNEVGEPGEPIVFDVNGFCGIAETENAEKSRVTETAKTVDFIII